MEFDTKINGYWITKNIIFYMKEDNEDFWYLKNIKTNKEIDEIKITTGMSIWKKIGYYLWRYDIWINKIPIIKTLVVSDVIGWILIKEIFK